MKNNIIKLEMFEAVCKCGHVGTDQYFEGHFAIKAATRKEAAEKARWIPRVKHHHKDAVLNVIKIDQERFNEIRAKNDREGYLRCTCIQDQRMIDISDRLIDETKKEDYKNRKEESNKPVFCKKKKIRFPKKYMTHYHDFEEYKNVYNIEEYNDIA